MGMGRHINNIPDSCYNLFVPVFFGLMLCLLKINILLNFYLIMSIFYLKVAYKSQKKNNF